MCLSSGLIYFTLLCSLLMRNNIVYLTHYIQDVCTRRALSRRTHPCVVTQQVPLVRRERNHVVTHKSAFTLVEMLVAMSIVFLMTGLSMANYNRFGREVELENAVYELALNIRQAQFFGINRSEQFGSTFDDPQPYGVFFDLDGVEEGVNDGSFIMYIDQDNDRHFEVSDNSYAGGEICVSNPSNECINILSFTRSNFISSICVGDNETNCNDISSVGDGQQQLHVSFKRPDPDAVIHANSVVSPYSYARITMSSPVSSISPKSVSIGAAGLISID